MPRNGFNHRLDSSLAVLLFRSFAVRGLLVLAASLGGLHIQSPLQHLQPHPALHAKTHTRSSLIRIPRAATAAKSEQAHRVHFYYPALDAKRTKKRRPQEPSSTGPTWCCPIARPSKNGRKRKKWLAHPVAYLLPARANLTRASCSPPVNPSVRRSRSYTN